MPREKAAGRGAAGCFLPDDHCRERRSALAAGCRDSDMAPVRGRSSRLRGEDVLKVTTCRNFAERIHQRGMVRERNRLIGVGF